MDALVSTYRTSQETGSIKRPPPSITQDNFYSSNSFRKERHLFYPIFLPQYRPPQNYHNDQTILKILSYAPIYRLALFPPYTDDNNPHGHAPYYDQARYSYEHRNSSNYPLSICLTTPIM